MNWAYDMIKIIESETNCIENNIVYVKMDNTQPIVDNQENIIAESKRRILEFLNNTITPEVITACPGIVLITLSIDEYTTLKRQLAENYQRKRQNARQAQQDEQLSFNVSHETLIV